MERFGESFFSVGSVSIFAILAFVFLSSDKTYKTEAPEYSVDRTDVSYFSIAFVVCPFFTNIRIFLKNCFKAESGFRVIAICRTFSAYTPLCILIHCVLVSAYLFFIYFFSAYLSKRDTFLQISLDIHLHLYLFVYSFYSSVYLFMLRVPFWPLVLGIPSEC